MQEMKYRLTQKIGSGGMAEVFRATGEGPEGFERAFVVKRILPRLSEAPEFVGMFVDEAKISARLLHPNIVQVFEFAYQDGGYYIVMEPVDGVDMGFLLRKLERREAVAPAAFVAEVGRQACRGLGFAHGLTSPDGKPYGIVHRDVTPPNIMVAWNGAVKIVDFGIARAVQQLRTSQTDAGTVKGKMSYIAPELLQAAAATATDARSDVFSLGVVLHELLTGRRLFVGDNDLETLEAGERDARCRSAVGAEPGGQARARRGDPARAGARPGPALPERRRDEPGSGAPGAAQALCGQRVRQAGARAGAGGRGGDRTGRARRDQFRAQRLVGGDRRGDAARRAAAAAGSAIATAQAAGAGRGVGALVGALRGAPARAGCRRCSPRRRRWC